MSEAVYTSTFKHAFRFLCAWPGDLSTRHVWRAIVAADLYARNRFSESMGSRGPGQKVHSFVDFCRIPLSKTCSCWHTSQEFVKMDLYPFSRGLSSLSGLVDNRPLHVPDVNWAHLLRLLHSASGKPYSYCIILATPTSIMILCFLHFFWQRGIKLSIVSPRKLAILYSLYEKACGDPQKPIKDYTTDPRHLVLLNGFELTGQCKGHTEMSWPSGLVHWICVLN